LLQFNSKINFEGGQPNEHPVLQFERIQTLEEENRSLQNYIANLEESVSANLKLIEKLENKS